MNEPARRLVGFALVLAGIFGSAYALGERLPGHSHAHSHVNSTTSHQLSPEADGRYTIRSIDGRAVTSFAKDHGALLHVVEVRPDGSGFQHIHPTIDADGSFAIATPDDGPWVVFAEGRPGGSDRGFLARTEIGADRPFTPSDAPLVATTTVVNVGGDQIAVTRRGLTFTISAPAPLEPYLEMPGHLVAVRVGDLRFAHLHATQPSPSQLVFSPPLTDDGLYRAYVQFGYRGGVVTVPMTIEVSGGRVAGDVTSATTNAHGGHGG